MNEELSALLITLLIATIPNLIIKLIEKSKPKSDLNKSSIEAADISLDMLKDTLMSCKADLSLLKEQNTVLVEINEAHKNDNEALRKQIECLEDELKIFRENVEGKIDKLGDNNAI